MNYIVNELQTVGGTTAVLTNTYTDKNQAESSFHNILKYAALSQVEIHSAVMLTEDGRLVRQECYRHPRVAEEPASNEEE